MVILTIITSCKNIPKKDNPDLSSDAAIEHHKTDFRKTLQKHLDAVANKNLDSLKSTLSPDGEMTLILPGSEIIHSVDSFMDFHIDWFKDTTWTFKTKILNTAIGNKVGTAVTEILYEEPDREEGPYFNRMIVTYVLKNRLIKKNKLNIYNYVKADIICFSDRCYSGNFLWSTGKKRGKPGRSESHCAKTKYHARRIF